MVSEILRVQRKEDVVMLDRIGIWLIAMGLMCLARGVAKRNGEQTSDVTRKMVVQLKQAALRRNV